MNLEEPELEHCGGETKPGASKVQDSMKRVYSTTSVPVMLAWCGVQVNPYVPGFIGAVTVAD